MCAYLHHTLTLDEGDVLRKMEPIPSSKGMTQTALALQRERAVFHLLRIFVEITGSVSFEGLSLTGKPESEVSYQRELSTSCLD